MTGSTDTFYTTLPVLRGFKSLMDSGALCAAAGGLDRRRRRRRGIDQGDRRAALQGGQHGGRRGDRGGDQCARRPRISVRVRRRRRELCGAAARRRIGARGAGGDGGLGRRRARSDAARRARSRSRRFARRASTCGWRATGRRTICPTRCSPAAGWPGPTARSKRGAFAVTPAPPGTWPDLTGLSCRFQEFRAARGLILSLLVMPAPGADAAAFRALTEEIVTLVEASPDAGRPVPAGGPKLRLAAARRRARDAHGAGDKPVASGARVLAKTLIALSDHALRPPRRRFCAGALYAPGRREFRLPQIRRRAAHDPRLHAAARRPHRAPAGRGRGQRRAMASTARTPR